MIGDLLRHTGRLETLHHPPLDAIVIGAGPSFLDWIRRPLPRAVYYGCGVVTRFVAVDVYLLGDLIHLAQVPAGKPVYATQRVLKSLPGDHGFLEYPDLELPHGGSSGGMALSLACRDHDVVGLIGFDGFGVDPEFVEHFRAVIRFWQSRGKRLISLMERSAFDDVLEHI